jgi:hypothetical protein
MTMADHVNSRSVVKVVFIALVLDLLGRITFVPPQSTRTRTHLAPSPPAFTLPLPLFPRLIDFYTLRESQDPHTLLSRSLSSFRALRSHLLAFGGRYAPTLAERPGLGGGNKKWDVVLLGGAMGSVFSLCQCVISPFLGSRECRAKNSSRSVGNPALLMLGMFPTVSVRQVR